MLNSLIGYLCPFSHKIGIRVCFAFEKYAKGFFATPEDAQKIS